MTCGVGEPLPQRHPALRRGRSLLSPAQV
jgi:hypothetical protein